MRDDILETLYNRYYTDFISNGAKDVEACTLAYEQACSDIKDMSHAEMRAYLKQIRGKVYA